MNVLRKALFILGAIVTRHLSPRSPQLLDGLTDDAD